MRRSAWLAVVALLAAAPADARFAPAAGAFRLERIEERDDGRQVRRFATTRIVTFARHGAGYTATMRIVPDSVAGDEGYRAVQRAMAAVPVEVELDREGRLTGVRDRDGAWARLRAALAAIGPANAAALRLHDAVPAAQRDIILAEPLTAVIAAELTSRKAGERPVTLPYARHDGTSGRASGMETTEAIGNAIIVATEAAGADGQAVFALRRRVRLTLRSGLAQEVVEQRRSRDGAASLMKTVTLRLTPAVS